MEEIREKPVNMWVYAIINDVLIHPNWLAGFLPSTVALEKLGVGR